LLIGVSFTYNTDVQYVIDTVTAGSRQDPKQAFGFCPGAPKSAETPEFAGQSSGFAWESAKGIITIGP
jgi:hypothetical protein